MGLNFEFATASRIIFGTGTVNQVPGIVRAMGRRVLLVTGSGGRTWGLTDNLPPAEFDVVHFKVGSEPTIESVSEGVEIARATGCEVVIGLGGGSAIDCAKAIAALTPNSGKVIDYLEVIGRGKNLDIPPLPFIAIPTTAGTGAEVTKNAVIHSPEHRVKVSLRSPLMFPDVAVVDPALTVSMPPHITATTGMDALTHLLETFVSNQLSPLTDAICREGIRRISFSLQRAFIDGEDLEARENMALAGMLGGIALANGRLGAVHGFAGPMGGMFPAPHGAVCAALLPAVMEVNIRTIREQEQFSYLEKYGEVARMLTGNPEANAQDGILWAKEMVEYLGIPKLSTFGVSPTDFSTLSEKARKASSMKGNPVLLCEESLMEILDKSA
jgi:alcohol dehydrogenase class IV